MNDLRDSMEYILLERKIHNCFNCDLYKGINSRVIFRGNGSSGVMLIGEAPGVTEDQKGAPFVGRSGKLLNNMILAMKIDPIDVYICNACKCRPPNNRRPTHQEINSCRPFLDKQIELIKPKIIIALGNSAAESLLGSGEGIMKRRLKEFFYNNTPVKCTLHPAACLRNPEYKKLVWEDLQFVMNKYLGAIT